MLKEYIPKFNCPDSTISLMTNGYLFLKNKSDQCNSDVFEIRLMGKKILCMTGEEAAQVFYDAERFERHGATPKWIQKSLFGKNGVQALDGDAHIQRKQLFLSLTTPQNQQLLAKLATNRWEAFLTRWESKDHIVLFDELSLLLCQVACRFAGVPLTKKELRVRTKDFIAMIDAFGCIGPRNIKGQVARMRTEEWIQNIIEKVRYGTQEAKPDTALYVIAFHTNMDGSQLKLQEAAVELINIIRPIVAIATYLTFVALALQEHPYYKEKLVSGDPQYYEMFVQEVRRLYPFAPFIGAKVRKNFTWKNVRFKTGTLTILDLYGTNHDERIFEHPNIFYPERFKNYSGSLFQFMPQGGGDVNLTHRCPGERFTTEMMKVGLHYLVNKMDYKVPSQDLSYSLVRMPTLPKSRFIMTDIKRKIQSDATA